MTDKKTEEVTEEVKAEEVKVDEDNPEVVLKGALAEQPGRPPEDQIEEWKAEHGEVSLFGFSEEDLYIFRPLMRGEYSALQRKMVEEQLDQLQWEELVLTTVVLYKSQDVPWSKAKAGTCSTLLELVMVGSNFFNPQVAATLVVRL